MSLHQLYGKEFRSLLEIKNIYKCLTELRYVEYALCFS